MSGIFNYNKGVFHAINKFADCILVSVLWLVFSLPVVTVGASTSALYYTVNKVIRNERSSVWKEFWSSFKLNFKQSTIVWIGVLLIYAVAAVCCAAAFVGSKAIGLPGIIVIYFVLTAYVAICAIYMFAYIARFVMPTKVVVKNCALIAIANLPWSILLYVVFVISGVLCVIFPIALVMVPAYYMMIADMILKKVFRKYMSAEDLERDLEWDIKGVSS